MGLEHRGRPSVADTGGSDGRDELAAQFSSFARTVQQRQDPHETLVEIVRAAVQLVPGCDEGSISVVLGRRRVFSDAASGELPRVVDALQEGLGEGPCLDSAYQHTTVRVPDMAREQRWPRFSTAAAEAGALGMMSFQLYVDGDDLGALNLFSRRAGAFTDESEHVGLMFAAHAGVAYAAARQRASLRREVETRHVIGQAQGILMERHRVTSEQAFAMLVRVSQHRNEKLRGVAQRLADSGHIDDVALPRARTSGPLPPRPPARMLGAMDMATWWAQLQPGSRDWLAAHAGEVLVPAVAEDVARVGGTSPTSDGSPVEDGPDGLCLTDAAVDWVVAVADGESP
ncbi:GAF and ANTAR domain-containing protein [Aquipuribacter hungaricus]|uniref:GAF and ANTAR domain-containing protein n=1 Tax=Aquipuribacter hungaricus TaxID=545624 RepID=A0ABV7WH75_9MICO